MIYGIIAIAVMASVYGLVNFLQTTFGISGGTVTLPPLP
jgi:Flp pilus assembly pilin Flp